MAEENVQEVTLEKVLELVADLGKRLDALENEVSEKRKPKAYKPCPKKAEKSEETAGEPKETDEAIEKALDYLIEAEVIDKDYRACMSACLKAGKSFKECVQECKKKAEKAKKPEAYKKPYPEEEESKAKPKYPAPKDEEEEKAKKPKAYKEPYPEKELKNMIERAIDEALSKRLGGASTVKKSVAPQAAAQRDPITMPLEELYKVPFSKIKRGEL